MSGRSYGLCRTIRDRSYLSGAFKVCVAKLFACVASVFFGACFGCEAVVAFGVARLPELDFRSDVAALAAGVCAGSVLASV